MSDFGKLNFNISLNPTSAFPLDARCYFESLEAAEAAAATAEEAGGTNSIYYYGQKLVVVDDSSATWYTIQPDKTLKVDGTGVADAELSDTSTNPIQNKAVSIKFADIDELLEMITEKIAGEVDIQADLIDQIKTALVNKAVDNENGSAINYDLNVKAVNHRGFSAEAPENTIPAYIMSKLKGFTYVECDVAFTSDSIAVLLHDDTIDRTSDGTGYIKNLTYAQVMQYDFGYSDKFGDVYKGTKIPTFKEFIVLCKNLGLHPYIELKSSGNYTQSQITQVVNEVAECGMKGKVTYISFNNEFLKYVKNADSSARLGLLGNPFNSTKLSQAVALKTTTNEVFADANLDKLTDSIVSSCISKGLPLEVWTVNEVSKIETMSPYITGVTSDSLIAGEILYNKSLVYEAPEVSYIPATKVTLSETSLSFEDLTPKTLTATVQPTNSSDKVIWSSSDEAIATVVNGVVTPKKTGNCTITAKAGSISATCAVTVDVNVEIYSVTRNLDNCISSSTVTAILENSSHTETISPASGYELSHESVTVTMGGVDITSCYNNGVLNIEVVTGDIVITAAAIKLPLIPVVDLELTSITDENTIINTGSGGTQYNATLNTVSGTDAFSTGENGLSLFGHAYANVPYGFSASTKFTIYVKGVYDELSQNQYQRLFRTDIDSPSVFYSYTSGAGLGAKLAGVSTSTSAFTTHNDKVYIVSKIDNSRLNTAYILPDDIDVNQNHSFAFVCDGSKIYYYIDGVLMATQKSSELKTSTRIGLGDNDPTKTYYADKITVSKFMIFDCALEAEEIANL
jgi:glycerophosphoryl diester phosphodiesterase